MDSLAGSLEVPLSDEINAAVVLFTQGRFTEGEVLAKELTARFPRHGAGWKIIGAMQKAQGRSAEALESMQKAAELLPGDSETYSNLGIILREQGRLTEAEASYRRALEIKPDFAEAHNNLGNALNDQGRLMEAEASYRRAIEINPHYIVAHINLGTTLNGQGRLTEAEASYRFALEINPADAESNFNFGDIFRKQGRLGEAEASYRMALEINPDFAEAFSNLGIILKAQGRLAEAEASYLSVLEIKPGDAETHYNLGNILKEQGRLMEAEASYRRALEIKPDFAEAFSNLGIILKEQGRLTEAEASYRRALEIRPDFAEAHNNLGNTLNDQGRLMEAEASYRRALEIHPQDAKAHNNLGNALNDQGRLMEAEASYRRALEIKPDFAKAHNNLGKTLNDQGLLAEAEASCRRALEIKPDFAEAYNNLGNTLKGQGRLKEAQASYRRALEIYPHYVKAHSNLLFCLNYDPSYDISYCLEEARKYGQMVEKKEGIRFSSWQYMPRPERLRVGLVSGDLRNHPVGYFLESMLTQIDSVRIELIAYHTDYKVDELTARIRPCFSSWKSLVGLSDENAANLIHADGVHLLLDLSGHTAKNRLPVFAWKPAPVQASWLGYFATTGVEEMDYLLTDGAGVSPTQQKHFTESVWYLPDTRLCFSPPYADLDVAEFPALKTGHITFGCFQNMAKVGDQVLAAWSKILNALPEARLRLQCKQMGDSKVAEKFVSRFQLYGIDPARVSLYGGMSRKDYFAAHNEVDMVLDTFPFPGGTTTCEALWMGVPTLTLAGDSMISRQGVSLLTAAGLADWVAASEADYVAKAIAIASDLTKMVTLRTQLRQQVLASPLFDAPRFARNFEAALWGMWKKWQKSKGIET